MNRICATVLFDAAAAAGSNNDQMADVTMAITIQAADFGPIKGGAGPLYSRIADSVSEYIRLKKFSEGTRLPTESQLAQHFRVSIITVRTALKLLADQGTIDRQQGLGTFVRRSNAAPSTWALGSINDLMHASQLSELKVLKQGFTALPKWAAGDLGSEIGSQHFNVQIVRSKNGQPFQLTDAFYPKGLGDQLARLDLAQQLEVNHLVVGAVEDVTGRKVELIRQTISACAASNPVAAALDLPLRTPLLLIGRVSCTADGQILQVARSHYQTKDFSYSFDLKRE
jgi:GntR family transcriptional regulator